MAADTPSAPATAPASPASPAPAPRFSPTAAIRRMSYDRAVRVGLVGAVVVALCSHAVGATRNRGGIMQSLGLSSLTFGHLAGILIVVLWIGVALLILSWTVVGGHILRHGATLRRSTVVAWTAPFLVAGPLMSRDVYSYLMQGSLARLGIAPYDHGAAANPGPLFFEVSSDWRNTTTPYGPLHLAIGDLVTSVTGENITLGVLVYKVISLACLAVLVVGVAGLARHLGARPSVAVWLGVVNPLSLIHLVGGMHNEVTMMAFVVTGLLAALRLPPVRGAVLGAVLVGLGVSVKATALIALPFLVWVAVARTVGPARSRAAGGSGRWRRAGAVVGLGAVCAAAVGAVLALVTLLSGQTWGWVREITGNTKVINPLSLPSLIAGILSRPLMALDDDVTFNGILTAVRPWSTVLMAVLLVATWWIWRRDARAALTGATVAYAVTCVLNAVVLPWYYAAPLALVGVWMRDRRGVFLVGWLCAVLSMMFDGGGNNRLYDLWWIVLVGAVTWWMLRATTGYSPLDAEERTDPWVLTPPDAATPDATAPAATAPDPAPTAGASADRHGLGPSHDLAGEVPVEGVDGAPGQ
ncbi:alpha-(1-_6)-mannopyranosyltransferase A [Corynebacterium bovis]|nr:alpha-(1->6)-mannopyranosyltransferase A [Corynebacterium bovis]